MREPLPRHDGALPNDRLVANSTHGEDGALGRIDDRGEASMPNMPRLEMLNVPSLISSGAQLLRLGLAGELAHLLGDGDDALLVGLANDRGDQTIGDRDGDRDIDAPVDEERFGGEARVALGHADERDGRTP